MITHICHNNYLRCFFILFFLIFWMFYVFIYTFSTCANVTPLLNLNVIVVAHFYFLDFPFRPTHKKHITYLSWIIYDIFRRWLKNRHRMIEYLLNCIWKVSMKRHCMTLKTNREIKLVNDDMNIRKCQLCLIYWILLSTHLNW